MRFNEIIDKVDELVNNISDFQYVYIYGAGKLAKMLVECLAEKNIHIAGVVTTCEPQDRNLDGILITAVDKLIIPENSVFLLATRVEFHTAILDTLINKKIRNIIPINKSLSWDIKRKYLLMRMNGRYELVESPYCALNHFTIAFKEKYRWRIHADISLPVINLINIWEKGLLESYEKEFGKYFSLQDMCLFSDEAEQDYIYAARSIMDTPCNIPKQNELIKYIQAGGSLTEIRLCDLQDNQGIHISQKNKIYSECTVLFWIWKNVKNAKYIGICHYRRHFAFSGNNLRALDKYGIDVVLVTPTILEMDVEKYFSGRYIPKYDWQLMMKAIKKYSENIYQTAQRYAKQHFYAPCNMLIMKKNILDEYCSFAFFVAEYIEGFYENNNIQREDRYMGYIIENLLPIYVMHNKNRLKVAYTDMNYYQ